MMLSQQINIPPFPRYKNKQDCRGLYIQYRSSGWLIAIVSLKRLLLNSYGLSLWKLLITNFISKIMCSLTKQNLREKETLPCFCSLLSTISLPSTATKGVPNYYSFCGHWKNKNKKQKQMQTISLQLTNPIPQKDPLLL